jgi:hypothetical protein
MPDKAASPFTGLDKALLRSTNPDAYDQAQRPAKSTHTTVPPPNTRRSSKPTQRPNGRTNERTKIRHSFDIYRDQLLELSEIQAHLFRTTGKKPKVGELVQEALDAYIERHERRSK